MNQVAARIATASPIAKPEPAYRLCPAAPVAMGSRPRKMPIQMRKLKYHVSASLDGYVIEDAHDRDAELRQADAMPAMPLWHTYGIVLMGRNTYQASLNQGIEDPYPQLMSYVFSSSWRARPGSPVEVVADDAVAWVRRLKACPGKDLYLRGSRLAASMFQAGLIDEVVVELSPMIRGSGRRVLSELTGEIALVRGGCLAYEDGTIVLSYQVRNEPERISE